MNDVEREGSFRGDDMKDVGPSINCICVMLLYGRRHPPELEQNEAREYGVKLACDERILNETGV
jgi:hypothetical protein